MDLIGPLSAVSDKGNIYILTVVNYATRYPEAVLLRDIGTEVVVEVPLEVFSRVGFANEVLSDRGVQFTSGLMEEVSHLIKVKQPFTTPYSPKCNGLCDRVNLMLNLMLRKMCQERPCDWDRFCQQCCLPIGMCPRQELGLAHLNCCMAVQ